MKNFIEFLAQRDPNLLQEYIDLASLSENSWYKYMIPLMLGAQANAQSATPTEIGAHAIDQPRTPTELVQKQNYNQTQNYNKGFKDITKANTEKEIYSRMFHQGTTIDDLIKNTKSKGFEQKSKKVDDKINAMKLPQNFRTNIPLTHIEDNYKPEEILFRKIVNPYETLKSTIPDPEKFQKDYNNLKSNPDDIGFAMNKDRLMNNKVLLIVVTDQAMKRFNPNAEGYASRLSTADDQTDINTVVLPKRAVKEIKDGKITLTDEGEQTLRHELRHTTQEGKPGERSQNSMSTYDTGWYKHYMNDPLEIGVRLGELKNHLSTKTLLQLTSHNPTHNDNIKEIIKDVGGNEKELLKLFMGLNQYKNTTIKKEKITGIDALQKSFLNSGKVTVNSKDNTIKYIKEKLAKSNDDIDSLFKHYEKLSDQEKEALMKELLDNYDNVVKNDTKTFNT